MSAVDDIEFKIARLDLQPGDILVARFKERLGPDAHKHIRNAWANLIPGVKILVLENGADLAILTAAEIEARSAAPQSEENAA